MEFTIRLCHMRKSKDEEYGFNLASKSDQLCHYVGRVDPNTPAYMSGLRPGDRIVEINDANVSGMNYSDIIKLIKKPGVKDHKRSKSTSDEQGVGSSPDELDLLVIDKQTEEHFKTYMSSSENYSLQKRLLKSKLHSATRGLADPGDLSINLNLNRSSLLHHQQLDNDPEIEMITYI